jgi:hypothetical protein
MSSTWSSIRRRGRTSWRRSWARSSAPTSRATHRAPTFDRPCRGSSWSWATPTSVPARETPIAIADLEALGAPVAFHIVAGHTHEDIVLDFDQGDDDAVPPLLEAFVTDVTR